MPELRRDPIVDRWVIIAENRAERPGAFAANGALESAWPAGSPALPSRDIPNDAISICPFCPGNEHETPPATFALRDDALLPNEPGWRVRIVPNKYPALTDKEVELGEPRGNAVRSRARAPFYSTVPAIGVHEVIIDTPRHITTVGELTNSELTDSLAATHSRLQAISHQPTLAHALVFKNVGRAAGATREHLHSQLMAAEITFSLVQAELNGAKRFFDEHGQCVFCRMIDEERALSHRVVCESASFVALCPFASRFPYETWILPKHHASRFERTALEDLVDLAKLAKSAIAKIERLSQPPDYNLIFHSSPFDSLTIEHYHWHIEILPRLTIPAGFEWGSGCAVNPVSPETAASVLRAIEG